MVSPRDGEIVWRITTRRFYNTAKTFACQIIEVAKGPGEGLLAIEFVGEKPMEQLERMREGNERLWAPWEG